MQTVNPQPLTVNRLPTSDFRLPSLNTAPAHSGNQRI